MLRLLMAAISVLLVASAVHADDSKKATTPAADRYKALVEQAEQEGRSRELAGRFIELAKKHSKDPVAVDALLWVVTNRRRGNEVSQAVSMLAAEHVTNEKLGPICARIARGPSVASEKLLRTLLTKNPHKSVKAQACFHLALYLKEQIRLSKSLKADPDSKKRFQQYYGKEVTKQFASLKESVVLKELEQLYEQVSKSFADVKVKDVAMGATAKKELFAIRNLSVGRTAPEITGQDADGKPIKLSQFRGKVILISFWGHW